MLKRLLEKLEERMTLCKLELHPDKTRIVYCRSDVIPEHHEHESFDFLGYTFRKRIVKSKRGIFFNGFTPAVSKSAGQHFRDRIREMRRSRKTSPLIRGWANYFSKFSAGEAKNVLNYVNLTLTQCIRYKYKSTGRVYIITSF